MRVERFEIPSLNTNFGKKLPLNGSLAKIPAYIIVLNCFKNKFSGRIIFENKQRIKHVYFKKGHILNIHSNLQDESFKAIILKKNLLQQDKVRKLSTKLDEIEAFRKENILEHHEQAKYLLDLKNDQLEAIEKHVCLEKLLDLLGWFQGDYLIQEEYLHNLPDIQFGVYLEILYKNLQNFFLHALPIFEQNYQSPKLDKKQFQSKSQLILTSISNVLSSLSYYNATGTLTLTKDDFTKKVLMKEGNIQSIESNKLNESLKTTLLRWNFLSPEKINFISSYSDDELEQLLIDDSSLTKHQLLQAQKILKFEKYLQLFHWKIGQFSFEGNVSENDTEPLPFSPNNPKQNIEHEDILNVIHTLKKDTVFLVFKQNLSLFKQLCEQLEFSTTENAFLNQEEFTIAQESLKPYSTQNIHYMVWEKLNYYTSQPKNVVCVLYQSADLNFIRSIEAQLNENAIKNLGFFILN